MAEVGVGMAVPMVAAVLVRVESVVEATVEMAVEMVARSEAMMAGAVQQAEVLSSSCIRFPPC